MVKQIINVGVTPNDRRGDPVRIAFQKSNENFTELYTNVASLSDVAFSGSYNDLLNIPPGGIGGTSDRLVNGTNQLVLDATGNLTLPKDLKFNDGVSSILARDPTTFGGIGGLSINGKRRTYITIGDDSYGYIWDFRPFGLNDFDSTVKPAIKFPGGGWLQEDLTDFDNISTQLGSQGSLTLTTKSNDMMNPTDYNWVLDTTGKLTLPIGGDIVDNTGTSVISGRVKSTAIGDRRIEEVTGFNQVSVTERITSNDIPATVYGSAAQNLNSYVEIVWDAALDAYLQGTTPYSLTVSTDGGNIWHPAYIGGNNPNVSQQLIVTSGQSVLQAAADSVIAYRVITGADPVVWWDKNTLPGGGQDFRGSVIDYHAWTGESTIIGTIHIVTDNGERHISHSEVASGSTDGENDDLWFVQNEGAISYRRIDGEAKTLKVHWTAKVFYGSEIWD